MKSTLVDRMDTQLQNYDTDIYTAPNKIKKIFINPAQLHFIKELKRHASEVCRNEISQSYINSTFNKFKNGFMYTIGNQLIGFIIWKIETYNFEEHLNTEHMPTKQLYIQIICAKKTDTNLGYTMLSDVESYCVKNGIPVISLKPVTKKIENYYHTYGFKTYAVLPEVIMTKPVEALLLLNINTSHTRKVGKKSKLNPHDKKLIQYLMDHSSELEEKINYERANFTKNFPTFLPYFLSKEYLQEEQPPSK
jgi:hypothetical protein